jgi:hypothetical protein
MWSKFINWLKRIWRKKPKRPGSAVNLEYDMANRRLTWGWPTVSSRQAPLKHAVIDLRVDPSLPWDFQDTVNYVEGEVPELLLLDVNPGQFFYRCTIVDIEDQTDPSPVVISIVGAYDPPGSAVNFTATDE